MALAAAITPIVSFSKFFVMGSWTSADGRSTSAGNRRTLVWMPAIDVVKSHRLYSRDLHHLITKMKFDQVIKHYGSQVAAAHATGVTQPTLSTCKARGRIPQLQQLRIEHLTEGKLKAAPEILRRKVSRP